MLVIPDVVARLVPLFSLAARLGLLHYFLPDKEQRVAAPNLLSFSSGGADPAWLRNYLKLARLH